MKNPEVETRSSREEKKKKKLRGEILDYGAKREETVVERKADRRRRGSGEREREKRGEREREESGCDPHP